MTRTRKSRERKKDSRRWGYIYIQKKWVPERREVWGGEKDQDAGVGALKCVARTCG